MSVMPEGPGLMDVPTVIPELGLAAQALASQVSFAKKTWKDGSGGGTPITAAELNRLEQGVADLTAAVNELRDSVSRVKLQKNAWAQSFEIEMPMDSFAICFCGKSIVGIWRSSTDTFLPEFPSGFTGEKTTNGVKITATGSKSGWVAIVVA